MRVYAVFDAEGICAGEFFDEMSHPPVVEMVPVKPDDAPPEMPEEGWPLVERFIRRNDAIPASATEITEADRAAIVSAPQYHRWSDGHLVARPIPPLTELMPNLSDRQFGEGLWRDGLISYDEYLAFVGPGTIPPALSAMLDQLPDDDSGRPTPRKVARGLVTGAQTYDFSNPLVDTIRQAKGWTDDQLREHWRAWAAL